ncbi:chromate efflux transporter [Pseudoalteromonas luteoviolacea]|uniref:Chorismate-binding protein n=1 Tax=Pseudoalteromonas luteoviolacea S4054 TaxID=1129367 RepID=A0A0F6A9B3_9GAMM|nr:chromate efflux transporter [Pseudoalteromonas luteoviolacea]AOT06883.1 chorismate-binding protein [Pseudoalteromonas luteoviolacea]AOT11801.1 chorismate-binding protein [Pseudoalteromonas luteoviolacea]AOT16713.1 chorismate-binding protein [Pseudoalteromonas luteoviolacea]KKE82792.1 chorismate-binding protein [Pseudoalteromonas luteoviolacea S4054]KZN73003.1 chorismate-binding protein [Pseudoalteromonas luteoviolacea S4047-1]
MLTIFKLFFMLGWVSFGGPAAHVGYFRQTFVEKLKWLDDHEYGQIVALSQFLPGPGSSQVGFALGYKRGGLGGAVAAFLGFTLPSILIMIGLAVVASQITQHDVFQSIVHGLKLLAVVVVADAAWGMYKNFCKNILTNSLCLMTAVALLVAPSILMQIAILAIAAVIGAQFLKSAPTEQTGVTFKPSYVPLCLFFVLLVGLPFVAHILPSVALFNDFYQAGSLVFGGGHVVLPLLQNIVGDQLSQDAFLTGYAAAQAVPGPMFTFATYIGYELLPSNPIMGSLIATLAVFLPGFLLLLAVLKNWQTLAQKPRIAGALTGVNAAVVGLLVAALYQPVFISAVFTPIDIALVLVGFFLLKQIKLPIIWLVSTFMLAGIVVGLV